MTIEELNKLLKNLNIRDIELTKLDFDIDKGKTVLIEIKIINKK